MSVVLIASWLLLTMCLPTIPSSGNSVATRNVVVLDGAAHIAQSPQTVGSVNRLYEPSSAARLIESERADQSPRGPRPATGDLGVPVPRNSLVSHDPIAIDNDTHFATLASSEGWPGNGSAGDPYIIQEYLMDCGENAIHGIWIRNTRSHFIVRSCTIDGAEWLDQRFLQDGIRLENVSNGVISGNYLSKHGEMGVFVIGSTLDLVIDNVFTNNSMAGIWLTGCSNVTVEKNQVPDNNDKGIVLDQCWNNTVSKNTCTFQSSGSGVLLRKCTEGGNLVTDNVLTDNQYGVSVVESDGNTIMNSTCSYNERSGIYLGGGAYWLGSHNNVILNNSCTDNIYQGILLENSSLFNHIENNTCSNNAYGIEGHDADSNTFAYNICNENTCGIKVSESDDNELLMNDFSIDDTGIWLLSSSSTDVLNNTCNFDGVGLHLDSYCSLSTIRWNTIADSLSDGLVVGFRSHSNSICDNILEDNAGSGIDVSVGSSYESPNDVVNNTVRRNHDCGLRLVLSDSQSICNNTIELNEPYGMYVYWSKDVVVSGNMFRLQSCGILIDGDSWDTYISDNVFSDSSVGVQLNAQVKELTVSENTITNSTYGVYVLGESYQSRVELNTISECDIGIFVSHANSNTLRGNVCRMCGIGISVHGSISNVVCDNSCLNSTDPGLGILIQACVSNSVWRNSAGWNNVGLFIEESNGTQIGNNTFTHSAVLGLGLDSESFDNHVNWNMLDSNLVNIADNGTSNDITFNYYSDYTGPDEDGDGLGDVPYDLAGDAGNQDQHPLVFLPLSPIWILQPQNQTIECGVEIVVGLHAAATTPIRWWVDDTVRFSIDADGILTNSTFVACGEYPVEIRAYNLYNASCSTTIFIRVIDTTSPVIDHPVDISMYENESNTLVWHVSDLNQGYYSLYLDGYEIEWGWLSDQYSTVSYLLHYLTLGVYNYTIVVCDIAGNSVADQVIVTVLETVTSTTTTTTTAIPIAPELLVVGVAGVGVALLAVAVLRRRR